MSGVVGDMGCHAMGVTLGPDDLVLSSGSLDNPPMEVLVEAAVAGGFAGLTLWPGDLPARSRCRRAHPRRRTDRGGYGPRSSCGWVPTIPEGRINEEAPREAVFEAAAALGATGVNSLLVCPGSATKEQAWRPWPAWPTRLPRSGRTRTWSSAATGPSPTSRQCRVVAATGRANCGLTVDFWHVFYGPGDFADFASVPGYLIGAIQLNDAPAEPPEDLAWATRYLRRVPGEGAMDLSGALRTIRGAGCHAPITLEVFDSGRLEALGPVGFAALLGDATRRVLAELDH